MLSQDWLSGLGFLLAFNLGFNRGSSYRSGFGERTTVVGVQQNLLQLADQRVARVGAGALVIESFDSQLVNLGQEVSFSD